MGSQHAGEVACPLCLAAETEHYTQDQRRLYRRCPQCGLVFVTTDQHLSSAAEKAIYDQHQNSPDDLQYRRFLSRLTEPLLERLGPCSRGLDFGCGPGPTLSVMMAEQGHDMAVYDLYYADNPAVLQGRYDFITSTEVVEHLANPGRGLNSLWAMLEKGGYLGLMTKLRTDQASFANWHYRNDPTHISFFSKETFNYLATAWSASLEFIGGDVIIFRK